MPFTFAHPAAILPLRRFRFLPTVPLIIGSVVPDVPYYFPDRIGRLFYDTHTLHGSIIPCLPMGLLLLVSILLLREPLTVLLSPRIRWLCLNSLERFSAQPLRWPLAVLAILIGTWTHLAWDSFTHPGGWTTSRVDALSAPVSLFGWDTAMNHMLQYVSSVLGLVIVAWWLWRLESRVPESVNGGTLSAAVRRLLLVLICLAAIAIGAWQGWRNWNMATYYHLAYLLLTRIIAWFATLYLAVGLIVMFSRRPVPEAAA
ncbi:MAG TPA: DUF4184 family protein [Steroidobacteraceae bacterium]